jgi:uncharacterized protein
MTSSLESQLRDAIKNGDISKIQHLISRGANLKYRDDWKRTPLIWAALGGLNGAEVVQTLLDAGADINAQNNQGMTALMEAALRDDTEIVKVLLKNRANADLSSKNGLRASSIAKDKAKKLLETKK